jgi:DNA-binding NarL/FixJ family response regulator
MREPVRITVFAGDPVSETGIAAQLQGWPEVTVVSHEDESAQVAFVVVDAIDEQAVTTLRRVQRSVGARVVVVATHVDDDGLLDAIEAGASGLLRRSEATAAALAGAARTTADGNGTMPPDLVGRLLTAVGRLQRQVLRPRGIHFSGFSERELAVLRLVADGHATGEIARRLSYSERTIKNVLHDVTSRLNLRNRSQAVAWALREGLI